MSPFSPAQFAGYAAFVLGVSAFLQRDDRRLKLLVAVESLVYTVHFWMLANIPASLGAFLTCFRSLVSLKTRSRMVAVLIIGLNIIVGLACAKTFTGWFPVLASSLGTFAFFMLEGIPMRLVLLLCTFLWLVNNYLSGSIGGTLLETTITIANISTLIRLFISRTRKDVGSPTLA